MLARRGPNRERGDLLLRKKRNSLGIKLERSGSAAGPGDWGRLPYKSGEKSIKHHKSGVSRGTSVQGGGRETGESRDGVAGKKKKGMGETIYQKKAQPVLGAEK